MKESPASTQIKAFAGLNIDMLTTRQQILNVFTAALILGRCCSGAQTPPLKIGVGRIVPITYFDEHHHAVGFSVDVINEAARREGIAVRWVPLVKGVADDLQSGAVDLLSAAMGTEERREEFFVSEPWWYQELSLLLRDGATVPPKRLGIEHVYVEFARPFYNPATFVIDPPDTNAVAAKESLAVCDGRLDATLITDGELRDLFLNRPAECSGVRLRSVDTRVTYGLSIIARGSRAATALRLRKRIDDLIRDGTLLRLAAAHPPISVSGAVQLQERGRKEYENRITSTSASALVLLTGILSWVLWDRQRRRSEHRNHVRAAMLRAEENVARGLARELHDDIGQRLGFLSVEIGRTVRELNPRDAIVTKLKDFQAKIQDASGAVRQVSHRMHPSILDDLGLSAAIEDLCAQTAKAGNLTVNFETRNVPEATDRAVSSCLYRVCQECLNNVLKHAQAESVQVTLSRETGVLNLTVADTGQGFKPEKGKNGIGTYTMNERVRLVNGTIAIRSEPGEGTTIVVEVPVG